MYLSGSQIRKVENGNRTLTPDLAKACENIPELGCNGALAELLGLLSEQLKQRPFPGWFEGWPEKEAQAKRLRTFQPLVVPGLLQTEAYARAILSTRLDSTPDEIEESVSGRMERQKILERDQPPEFSVILDEVVRTEIPGPVRLEGAPALLIEHGLDALADADTIVVPGQARPVPPSEQVRAALATAAYRSTFHRPAHAGGAEDPATH